MVCYKGAGSGSTVTGDYYVLFVTHINTVFLPFDNIVVLLL